MNNPSPRISVVIPHLNQNHALVSCLRSLAEQSYPRDRFEVIVVDNGSRAVPTDIVDRFPGCRLAHEPTPGPGPARNRGVTLSTGAILAFIDADCTADRGWLEAFARRFDENDDIAILGGDVRIAYADPQRLTMLEAYESVFAYRQREYIAKHGFSGTGNLAVRRAAFVRIGPFAGIEVAEDREWGRRARALGYTIGYVDAAIIYHPARQELAQLQQKWRRHIDHDYAERRARGQGRLAWLARGVAIALSPLVDARRILVSSRISGWRARGLAQLALTRIRLWRAARMLTLAFAKNQGIAARGWNR